MNNPIIVPMCMSVSDVVFPMQCSSNMESLEPGVASAFILNGRVTGVKGSAETDFRIGDVSLSPSDLGIDTSVYALRSELPTKTSDLTNDSDFVSDPHYVHTDVNFSTADAEKLQSLRNLVITVGSSDYEVLGLWHTEYLGISGIMLVYDDGTMDGGMIFVADGDGLMTYDQIISNTYATKAEVPHATSELTNDSGFITSASLPTKTSDLLNDSGFIDGAEVPSHETDPTVPSWAKAAQKPSYTASEVGALPDTTVIPSQTSQLTNDSGFITASDIPTDVSDFVNDVPYAVANNEGASLSTMAIPYGSVDGTSTSTAFTATVPGITELKTGVIMMLHNGVVTSASGFTIDINNLGAKPVFNSMTLATRETTLFNINYTMIMVYNEDLDDGNGGWWNYRGYNSDTNTIGYTIRTNSMSLPMDSVTYRYRILFSSMDGERLIPSNNSSSTNATASRTVNQTPIDPFGRIVYYSTTASVAAGSRPSAAYLLEQSTLTLGYSFNRQGSALTLTSYKPVWLKTAPQSDGSVIIDSTTPYVQNLPTTEDGKVYIFLGVAYSATQIELTLQHPVKHYKDGAIRNWWG